LSKVNRKTVVYYTLPEKRAMDIEGTIAFLLEQQARFAAQQVEFASDIQAIKEVLRAQQEQFAASISQINTVLLDLATAQERTNEIVVTLAEPHVGVVEQHKVVEQALNALISTVERHTTVTIELFQMGLNPPTMSRK
jgi:hypothetical protein